MNYVISDAHIGQYFLSFVSDDYLNKYILSYLDVKSMVCLASISRKHRQIIRKHDIYSQFLKYFIVSDKSIFTILHTICSHGNIEVLACFLAGFQNISDKDLELGLYECAAAGHLKMFQYLEERGIKYHTYTALRKCMVPLRVSSTDLSVDVHSHIDLIRYIARKISYLCSSDFVECALLGHVEIIECLLQTFPKFDVNEMHDFGRYWTIFEVCAVDTDPKMVECLMKRDVKEITINNALMRCAEKGRLDVIKCIIEGSDKRIDCARLIINAAKFGYLDMVQYIVDKYYKSYYYWIHTDLYPDISNALTAAVRKGHLNIVEYLLNSLSKDNIDKYLHHASRKGHLEIVKYLVEMGADPKSNNNWSLSESLKYDHYHVLHYLTGVIIGQNNL
jgi:uncharacterized protein